MIYPAIEKTVDIVDTVIDSDVKGEIRFPDKDYKIYPDNLTLEAPNSLYGRISEFNPAGNSAVFDLHNDFGCRIKSFPEREGFLF